MSEDEIRWYKGKWKVRVIQKSNVDVKRKHLIRNVMVEALEPVEYEGLRGQKWILREGDGFVTVPRLLWRHPRK